ncbi:MAG: hypothetical protein Q9225_007508, partial [Loekoesia sp. 1 TL-2023]
IYIEAVDLLYDTNTFNIDALEPLQMFIKWIGQRVQAIQTVHVNIAMWRIRYRDVTRFTEVAFAEWSQFWELLAQYFTGLQHVRLDIYGTSRAGLNQGDLDPVLGLRGLKSFDLAVWRDTDEEESDVRRCTHISELRVPWLPVPDGLDFRSVSPVNNPKPLAEHRKSISETLNPSDLQSCPLLAHLPWEIRSQIWRYALGDNVFHIELLPGRLGSRVCSGCIKEAGQCHGLWHFEGTEKDSCFAQKFGVTSLPQTCHQVYNETIDLLYSSNTFDISDLGILKYFVQGVPSRRLSLIRNLCVHWQDWSWYSIGPTPHLGFAGTWNMFWRITLDEFKGLRTISIRICSAESEHPMSDEGIHPYAIEGELTEWGIWWEPYVDLRCRTILGKRKTLKN